MSNISDIWWNLYNQLIALNSLISRTQDDTRRESMKKVERQLQEAIDTIHHELLKVEK